MGIYLAKGDDNSDMNKQMKALEKDGFVVGTKSSGYLLKDGTIVQPQKVDTKGDDYQAMLSALTRVNANTVYEVTLRDPALQGQFITRYVPESSNGSNYGGHQDPRFFTAVPQGSKSRLANLLNDLAAKGYLDKKEMNVHWSGDAIVGHADKTYGQYSMSPMDLYFTTDKGKDMVSLNYTNIDLTVMKQTFGKPYTFTAKVNQGFFGPAGMKYDTNIEATKTMTDLAGLESVKKALSYGDLHNLKDLAKKAGTSVVELQVVAQGPNTAPDAQIGNSVYDGVKKTDYTIYRSTKAHGGVKVYGYWKFTKVASRDKKPDADGNMNAEIQYTFHAEPAYAKIPIAELNAFSGRDLPKDGQTRTKTCHLTQMKDGFNVDNCEDVRTP